MFFFMLIKSQLQERSDPWSARIIWHVPATLLDGVKSRVSGCQWWHVPIVAMEETHRIHAAQRRSDGIQLMGSTIGPEGRAHADSGKKIDRWCLTYTAGRYPQICTCRLQCKRYGTCWRGCLDRVTLEPGTGSKDDVEYKYPSNSDPVRVSVGSGSKRYCTWDLNQQLYLL